jgi:phenol 2-monooxygenase
VYEDVDGKGLATYGISGEDGALVLVRPDGYVSLVTELDQPQEVVDFLDSFMVEGQWLQEEITPVKKVEWVC